MTAPLEVVADELERCGVRRLDPKALLLGYLIGRGWPHTDDTLRRTVQTLYGPKRAKTHNQQT